MRELLIHLDFQLLRFAQKGLDEVAIFRRKDDYQFSLRRVFKRELQFPEYFGENWDALRDCLRDLSWLSENKVVIYHEELPRLVAEGDLATYLDILHCTVREREFEDPPSENW